MAGRDGQLAEQLQRSKRRWQVAAILATCSLVVVVIVATSRVVALNARLEREQQKAQLATRRARIIAEAATEAARRAATAARRSSVEPGNLEPVNFLFPTDQMYRLLPDEERKTHQRVRPSPLNDFNVIENPQKKKGFPDHIQLDDGR